MSGFLISSAGGREDKAGLLITELGIPTVMLDRALHEGDHVSAIQSDHVNGIHNAVHHLIENGHRDIAFIGGPVNFFLTQQRLTGYLVGLGEAGISPNQDLIRFSAFTETDAFAEGMVLLSQDCLPTALIAGGNVILVGLLLAIPNLNIEVGRDLSELGQDEQQKHAKYKRWVEKDPTQAAVWRYAWDMLLQDGPTYDDICEALAARGYRFRDGRVNRRGKVVNNRQELSRVFHNWFYAGWVVVQNDWADIPPKTVRGEWEPIVSTEEFEYGLAILAKRNRRPIPKKRNFYLLQGHVFAEMEDGQQIKLRCSRPNKKRTANGVSYYRVSIQQ